MAQRCDTGSVCQLIAAWAARPRKLGSLDKRQKERPEDRGVDVGGTNTDAAILGAGNKVIGYAKAPTSLDVISGIKDSVSRVLSTTAVGGFEYDGGTEIGPIKEAEVRAAVREDLREGITSIVISGVFSPVNSSQEARVKELVEDEIQNASAECGTTVETHITLSHEVAQLGILERENAAILNAALRPLAAQLVPAFQEAMQVAGISGRLFLTSNDGTLISAETAMQAPIATVQSGPVNSLRGAAFLSGVQDGLVIDIGGTTTDVGVLIKGLPRPAGATVDIAGVRTNFALPDILSTGLGGGSHVEWAEAGQAEGRNGRCTVGPQSVGHELASKALATGGHVCTATDVVVLLGKMEFGDADLVRAGLKEEQALDAWQVMQQRLADIVDQMMTSKGDVPVVVVGGGASLCDDLLEGASSLIRPPFASVANAVGAAIPQVSGVVDGVYSLGGGPEQRASVLADAEAAAKAQAIKAGADPQRCQTVIKEEIPLAYLPGGVARVHIRVVGDLADPISVSPGRSAPAAQEAQPISKSALKPQEHVTPTVQQDAHVEAASSAAEDVPRSISAPSETWYTWEQQRDASGAWILGRRDIDVISIGCGILGTGGGGSPYINRLKVLRELDKGGTIRVIDPEVVPDNALVAEAGGMGAPTVGLEKLDAFECELALQAHTTADPQHRPLFAVMSCEIGGGNGLEPLAIGASMGLPVVDADFMGRAFPELQMMTSAIYGHSLTPAALADEKGNVVMVQQCASPHWLEWLLRPVCTAMGCAAGLSTNPLTGRDLRRMAVPHTVTLAWRLGRAVLTALAAKADAVHAAAVEGGGRLLFTGKITDVQRSTSEGFARGHVTIEGLREDQGRVMTIQFQNENLLAHVDGRLVLSVPDLICCLSTDGGQAFQTEHLRYGLRVSIVGLPAHPLLRTPEALAVVGPAAFGFEGVVYTPLGD
ncbi:probable D-/L-hydantoinase subunit A at N-terminal half [Coccomyxa sp. Obi]|nr:probable D-/L-hydantoinase subunit A at N-terminal half [Coccomyxa sp. Obi]